MVAIGIVGAIAAMSIPSMVNNIQNRLLTTQLKSITLSVKQLADEQMIKNKTKDLSNTDFANPSELFSGSNFSIAETCAAQSDCWGTEKYKSLNGGTSDIPGNGRNCPVSVKLKNGAVVSYKVVSPTEHDIDGDDGLFGQFIVDVNGTDKPNIAGRDYFLFYITKRGKLAEYGIIKANKYTDAQYLHTCRNGSVPSSCYGLIEKNNWKMPY